MSFKPKGQLHHPDATPEEQAAAERQQAGLNRMYENGVGAWNMDDFYVIAAHSEEEAKRFYLEDMNGIPWEGFPIQIADLDARKISLMSEDERTVEQTVTFRERIRTMHKVPEILCQTES